VTRERPTADASVREDLNIELCNVLRVGDCVDRHNPVIGNRERQHDAQPSLQHDGQSHSSIHKGDSRGLGTALERLGNGRSASDFGRSTHLHGRAIGAEYDLGIENPQQLSKVAVARGGQESGGNLALSSHIVVGTEWRSLYPATCTACELPRRHRRAADDRPNLFEWQIKHVVQHKGHPFRGGAAF